MANYYSPTTGMTYSSKEQMKEMEKKYLVDILKKQEEQLDKANKIAEQNMKINQEKMQIEKENEELIVESSTNEEDENEENMDFDKMILEEEKEKTKNQNLCDKLGIDYEELLEFNSKFIYGKVSFDSMFLKRKQVLKKKWQLKQIKEGKNIYEYSENDVDFDKSDIRTYSIEDIEDRIDEEKNKIEQVSNIKYSFLQIIIDLPLICWVLYQFWLWFSIGNGLDLFILSIVVFIVFNFICKVDIKVKMSNIIRKSNDNIEKLKKEMSRRKSLAKKQQKSQIKKIENEIRELEKSIEEDEDKNYEYAKKLYDEFVNFRIAHYNEKIEKLFKRIHLDRINILDEVYETNNKSIEKLKTGEGTVKDYMNYIRKVLR